MSARFRAFANHRVYAALFALLGKLRRRDNMHNHCTGVFKSLREERRISGRCKNDFDLFVDANLNQFFDVAAQQRNIDGERKLRA